MSVPAVSCEARKASYRQSKEGLVVSFVIHPSDMPDALAVAPLGQRYMLALAAIGDDEQPVPVQQQETPSDRSAKAKAKYASSTERQQALVRAARLPKDQRFQHWVWDHTGFPSDEAGAIEFLRHKCGGSRKNIDTDDVAYTAFIAIETDFKADVGLMPEVR